MAPGAWPSMKGKMTVLTTWMTSMCVPRPLQVSILYVGSRMAEVAARLGGCIILLAPLCSISGANFQPWEERSPSLVCGSQRYLSSAVITSFSQKSFTFVAQDDGERLAKVAAERALLSTIPDHVMRELERHEAEAKVEAEKLKASAREASLTLQHAAACVKDTLRIDMISPTLSIDASCE